MKKRISKMPKEERIVFIVIAIIVLLAIGILLTWYFTKENETDYDQTPPVNNERPNGEEEEEEDPIVLAPALDIRLPGLFSEYFFIGDVITINPRVVVDGKEVIAVVKVQQFINGVWVTIPVTGNTFIPTEAGKYRFVYSFLGMIRVVHFEVRARNVVVPEPPVTPEIPEIPEVIEFGWTGMNTRLIVGREIAVPQNVLVNGVLTPCSIVVENLAGVVVSVNNTFIPVTPGDEYVYVCVFNNERQILNITVIDELLLLPVASNAIGGGGRNPFTSPSPSDVEAYDRFNLINRNLNRLDINQLSNTIEIRINESLETFVTTRPLQTPVGFIINSPSIDISQGITSTTPGVYIDNIQDVYQAAGIINANEVLIWLDFNDFNYGVLTDIELKIGNETYVFTVIFRNFKVEAEAAVLVAQTATEVLLDVTNTFVDPANVTGIAIDAAQNAINAARELVNSLDDLVPGKVALTIMLDDYQAFVDEAQIIILGLIVKLDDVVLEKPVLDITQYNYEPIIEKEENVIDTAYELEIELDNLVLEYPILDDIQDYYEVPKEEVKEYLIEIKY